VSKLVRFFWDTVYLQTINQP